MEVFREMDKDDSSTLTEGEIRKFLESSKHSGVLQRMGIDIKDIKAFTTLLTEQRGMQAGDSVDVHSFVSACVQLKGAAMCLDLYSSELRLGAMLGKHSAKLLACMDRLDQIDGEARTLMV